MKVTTLFKKERIAKAKAEGTYKAPNFKKNKREVK